MANRDFGRGTYRAIQIAERVILITATGLVPNMQTKAVLERMPWRIYPPHFGLFFECDAQIVSPAMKPFSVTLLTAYPDVPTVNMVDADGVQSIDILTYDALFDSVDPDLEAHFAVWQQIGHSGECVVAPVNAIMPAIYFNATYHLGPLSYKQADDWKLNNCTAVKKKK